MEITYTQKGDYLYPNLAIDPEDQVDVGKYGQMRRRYLKEHRPGLYGALWIEGKLTPHLLEINEQALDMMESLTKQMAKSEGVTEQLKAEDQMEWVRRMNSIHSRALEIVNTELIYA